MERLEGKMYEALREFVLTAEDAARREIMRDRLRAKRSSRARRDCHFVFFEAVMKKVMGAGGDPTVQWVLRDQDDA